MFDWGNFFSTLIGAGFGALGVYCFNLRQADKQQKETEKARLLKLFYDINILLKTFSYHHENTVAEINNLTESELKSVVPITIKNTNFKVEEYGFITKYSPLLYEILTYVHNDINYIYEQQDMLTVLMSKRVKLEIYIDKLEHIEISTVKLLAKLFISLKNINNALIKYYKCENLIKDEVVNGYIRAKRILDKTKYNYAEILNDKLLKRNYNNEEIKTIKADLEYINEILDIWIIDFCLKSKQKASLEVEIKKTIQNN